MTFVLVVAASIPVTASSAAPELRWIAYVQADLHEYRGAVATVRSDGREGRTLIDEYVSSVDVGPRGHVFAVQETESGPDIPLESSVIMASITGEATKALYENDPHAYYNAVAASSDGDVALAQSFMQEQEVPPFLSGGVNVLRSVTIPILVPPEEPPGTGGLVPDAEENSYRLLFTNDPAGELAHVEQVNVFVSGSSGSSEPISEQQSQLVTVRDTDGRFFCGASTCFLTWKEHDATYTVGEFGAKEEAVAFAESLIRMEFIAGSFWREGKGESFPLPQLLVRHAGGNERLLASGEELCGRFKLESGFACFSIPLDWNSDNNRVLVLAGVDVYAALQVHRADGSVDPVTLAEGYLDETGQDPVRDAAFGPQGVVALFVGESGPPGTGTLRVLDNNDVLATAVRAFDIEGSTLAYVSESGDVIVRDLETGNERTVGEGAIDVSVAPDLIAGSGTPRTNASPREGGLPGVLFVVIGLAGVALLAGAALLLVARRRGLD